MNGHDIGTVLYALILLIGLAMLIFPGRFVTSGVSTAKGARLLGVLFTMVGAANLIDRF